MNGVERVKSVDVMRVAAIISVIAIHTTPFETQSSSIGRALDLATVVNQSARFAVPLFFVLSGYYWAHKFKDESDVIAPTLRMAKRIVTLFLVWSTIYLLPMNIFELSSTGFLAGAIKQLYLNIVNALNNPLITVFQGTKVHLWFFTGLLCSLLASALLLRFGLIRLLVFVGVTMYLVGLAGKAYRDTPIGFHTTFNLRDGPFFSLIFFVTGYLLQRRQARSHWLVIGCLVAAIGAALQFLELMILNIKWGTAMTQDYVFGTYFLGVGAALVALSNARWLRLSRLASMGQLVLGIYASHIVFVGLLRPIDRRYSGIAAWDITYVVAVFLLSYMFASALARHPLTRRLVA